LFFIFQKPTQSQGSPELLDYKEVEMNDVITGYHAIEERMRKSPEGVSLLFAKPSKRNNLLKDLALEMDIHVAEITISELDRIAGGFDHRGVALEVPKITPPGEIEFELWLKSFKKENALVVILNGITDPRNYGAILRSADKFEVDLVIVPSKRSARETQVVYTSSAGAVSWVPHATVPNLARTIEQLKDAKFWVYGADMGGQAADTSNLTGRVALVMGSEGKGMSRLVKENCDVLVSVPTLGHVDSLNVSVAAGILMYEVRRQQKYFHHN
jgi:23S rRNA (guanosine2251-2'-O)-methyltransferase